METEEIGAIPQPDYERHPAYGGKFTKPSLKENWLAVRKVSPSVWKIFREYLSWRSTWWKNRVQNGRPSTRLVESMEKLARDGAIGLDLPADDKAWTLEQLAPWVKKLETQRSERAKRRFRDNTIRVEDPSFLCGLESRLVSAGYLDLASAYLGIRLRIRRAYVVIFGEKDTSFWKKGFAGTDFGPPETTYMHLDSTFGSIKFLLYLNEVTEENGPFRYVLGSNRFDRFPGELILRKAMDISRLDSLSEESRRTFYALPALLRRKCAFGYDLRDDDPGARALLAREKQFTSREGDLILFDYDGIHRGGMVKRGERRMLQIQLAPTSGGREGAM